MNPQALSHFSRSVVVLNDRALSDTHGVLPQTSYSQRCELVLSTMATDTVASSAFENFSKLYAWAAPWSQTKTTASCYV